MTGTAHTPRLWMVRHAPPLVSEGTCYGRLDLPADPTATRRTAQRLAQAHSAHWAAASHSTLQRCEHLALDLKALQPDWSIIPDARLIELDFGTWEGRPWSEVARGDIDAWTAAFYHYRPGQGEALADMLARVSQALQAARAMAWSANGNGGDVLWITHAGVVRCVQWLLAHGTRPPRSEEWPAPAPSYGEWTTVPLTAPAPHEA